MEHNVYLYIAVVALVTYLIRVLPLTLIRRKLWSCRGSYRNSNFFNYRRGIYNEYLLL